MLATRVLEANLENLRAEHKRIAETVTQLDIRRIELEGAIKNNLQLIQSVKEREKEEYETASASAVEVPAELVNENDTESKTPQRSDTN